MVDPDALSRLAPATRAVAAGRPPHAPDAAVNPAISLTSTYVAGGSLGYGRYGNETWQAFEAALGALEGGTALLFASGMGAVSAVLELVPVGGTVLAPVGAYSGTMAQLDRLAAAGRIGVRYVDVARTPDVLAELPRAALLWIESPTNPLLTVADLPALLGAARSAGVRTAVDNTFATPLLQRPLDLGADVVVHSATKYLSGHSDVLLGATVTRDDALHGQLLEVRGLSGAIPGPFEAWLALRGLRTLHLRVERAGTNAAELAGRLLGHPAVSRVRYPGLPNDPGHARAAAQMSGFGGVLAVELAGGGEAAQRWCESTQLWTHATSLGGVESLLERRRRWPAESRAVPESLVRLSVGVEDVEDLWDDLVQAFDRL